MDVSTVEPTVDPNVNPSRSQVSIKTVLTISLTVLLIGSAVAFLVATRLALTLTVAAALIAAALHHFVDFFTRHHVRRGWALAWTLLGFFAALAGILMLVIPPAVGQASNLASQLPHMLKDAKDTALYRDLDARFHIGQLMSAPPSRSIEATAGPALKAITTVIDLLAEIVSTIFLVIFMLVFGEQLVRSLIAQALPGRRHRYEGVAHSIYSSVGGYVAGLGFICLVNATLTTTYLAIARVPFFLTLGIASGFSSLIPYAGPIAAGGTVTLLALATRGPWIGLATFVYYLLYGQLEGQILGPLVYRRTVHVSPLVTFLSILFFVELAGIIGAVIAVPAAAAGQIVLQHLLKMRRERLHLE
jgi:predicted PurR-regulated permease PerM